MIIQYDYVMYRLCALTYPIPELHSIETRVESSQARLGGPQLICGTVTIIGTRHQKRVIMSAGVVHGNVRF